MVVLLCATPAARASVVAYYTFDNSTGYDSTANNYNATSVSVGLTYETEVPTAIGSGKSLRWPDNPSTARYVAIPTIRGLGKQFTVTMWAKIPSTFTNCSTCGQRTLLANNQLGTTNGFSMAVNSWNSDNRFTWFQTANGGTSLNANTDYALTKNVWHHIAITRDGSVAAFYVDGVQRNSPWPNVLTDFALNLGLRIGANMQAGNAQCWVGWIDDVAIWDEVVSTTVLANLTAGTDSPAAHMISPARCAAYYTFNDTLNDATVNHYNYTGTAGLTYSTDVSSALGSGKSLYWADASIARYVAIPKIPDLADKFAITMWVKIPSAYINGVTQRTLLANNNLASTGFSMAVNTWTSDDRYLYFQTNNGGTSLNSCTNNGGQAISKGVWHHIAIIRDGNDSAFYIDGVNAGYYNNLHNVLPDFGLDQGLRIGANLQASPAACWVGYIDDVAVWNGIPSENIIANLAIGADSPANHLVPSWWPTNFIDELRPFYRHQTNVDVWLKDYGMSVVPDYWTTAGDFPYIKRPYTHEGFFTDDWFVVRPLGGWPPTRLDNGGIGECIGGTDITSYDVAYKVGDTFTYNWTKLDARIDPFLAYGYDNITLVLDNVCWDFPTTTPDWGFYGQWYPPQYFWDWYWFMRNLAYHISTRYPTKAYKWQYRIGTELNTGVLWKGNATQLEQFYDFATAGIRYHFPNAKLGPYEYFNFTSPAIFNPNGQIDFVQHCATGTNYNTGSTGSPYDFTAKSLYRTNSWYLNPRAAVSANDAEFDTIESVLGRTPPREVHQYGILTNEWGDSTPEPGAYGAVWNFNMLMGLYSKGWTKIQHWGVHENMSGKTLLQGQYWPCLILDHLLGSNAYKLTSPPDSAAGTQYEAYAFDMGDGTKYLMFSAWNDTRTTVDSRSVTFTVPRDMLSISETSKLTQTQLTLMTSVYDRIRLTLAANGWLLAPWSTHNGSVSYVAGAQPMASAAGLSWLANNWTTYENIFNSSLTLVNYTGAYTKTATDHQFVVTMSNPGIYVIAVKQ